MEIKWSVYWTKTHYGEIVFPPIRDTTYTYADINECFRRLESNIAITHWQGYVDECK